MTVLTELRTYLASELSLTYGTDLFTHRMPDTPDAVLVLYETGGSGAALGLGVDGVQFESPAVQVVCRGAALDFDTPRAQAESAFVALAKIQAESLSGTPYLLVRPLNSPNGALGPDEKNRPRFSFNVLVEKELSA